jgi:hypothetical protein
MFLEWQTRETGRESIHCRGTSGEWDEFGYGADPGIFPKQRTSSPMVNRFVSCRQAPDARGEDDCLAIEDGGKRFFPWKTFERSRLREPIKWNFSRST